MPPPPSSSSTNQQPRPLPAPAILTASSVNPSVNPRSSTSTWIHPHRLPHRRFIGRLPEDVVTHSTHQIGVEEEERRRRWRSDRRPGHEHQGLPIRKERRQGGWVDERTRNPVKRVGKVGKGVVDRLTGQVQTYDPHEPVRRASSSVSIDVDVDVDGYSITAGSSNSLTPKRTRTRWTPWRSHDQTRQPSVYSDVVGEQSGSGSFDIGQAFVDELDRSRTRSGSGSGSGSEQEQASQRRKTSRCERRFRGLIDVEDEFISTGPSSSSSSSSGSSIEGEDERRNPDLERTIYGSPMSISTSLHPDPHSDPKDRRDPDRPSLKSRGTTATTGTGVQSFSTARTHQPSTRTTTTGKDGLLEENDQISSMVVEDFQSAVSTLPPPGSSSTHPSSTLDEHGYRYRPWERTGSGSSSTAGGGGGTTTTATTTATNRTTDPFGSTRELIPPETGVTYNTSGPGWSDRVGVGSGQVGRDGKREEVEMVGSRSLSLPMPLPLPRSTKDPAGKLKSALKFGSKGGSVVGGGVDVDRPGSRLGLMDKDEVVVKGLGGRTKTVQFPLEAEGVDDRGEGRGDLGRLKGRLKGLRSRSKDDNQEEEDADDPDDHSLEPADPRQVLARTGDEVVGTSAGVVEAAHQADIRKEPNLATPDRLKPSKTPGQQPRDKKPTMSNGELGLDPTEHTADDVGPDAVVLRDRMLLRVGRNRDRGLTDFDEAMLRRKPCSRLDRMQEYLVVYRKGRIELYQEWRIPLKERFVQSKRLCFTIPLHPKYTTFSLFSPVDLSFALCLDSMPFLEELEGQQGERKAAKIRQKLKDSKQLQWLKNGRGDTQVFIFIFNCRERRRAMDWMWEIWKELDGVLPQTLDVGIPDLQTTIRLKRPIEDSVGSMATCRALSRSKVLISCLEGLRKLPRFDDLVQGVEREMGERPRLEVAWQRQGHLDWITKQDERAEDGHRREWALLAGFAMLNPKHPARLVVRPARHVTSMMKLTDGSKLEEPPSIEGYLYRLGKKTGSKTREQIYVYSYGGNLFSSVPRNVRPPLPPDHVAMTGSENDMKLLDAFMKDEYTRGAGNVMECTGFVDFRDIVAVRSKPNRPKKPKMTSNTRTNEIETARREHSLSDKGSKIFEIVLGNTGDKVRFEAHNHDVAKEWIDRLRKLHDYWSHRQRIDARERMDTVRSSLRGPEKYLEDAMENSIDPEMPLQWNWCPIENCSPIVHSGRLFIKESRSSQFRAYFTVLTQGHLVLFKFEANTAFHRKTNRYSLLESYIYSGVLADAELISVLQENAFEGEARIYQDGLECADGAEDCTFVIWMRKRDHHSLRTKRPSTEAHQLTKPSERYNPPLLGKPATVLLVLRARSKLERDKWVKTIQIEIQRQAVAHPERTRKARAHGLVPEGKSLR